MAKTAVTVFRLLTISLGAVSSLSMYAQRSEDNQRSYYAAVFLNRGHISGGATSNIGLFKRIPGDTVWSNMYHPNLFTFGIGFWERGTTRRYYIAAGNGLHRSTDGGKTWCVLTTWKTEEILSVALDPVDSSILYVATPFGVFKSTDDGARWERKAKGMKKWYVQRIIVDRANPQTLYAAAEDDLYETTDGGEHWNQLRVGVPGILSVLQHPQRASVILVGTEDHGVQVTTDGGQTWRSGQDLPQTSFYALRSSGSGETLYAGGYQTGLWKSEDLGRSWSLVWPAPGVEAIYSIFVHPDDPKHLLVGTCGQGVYESFDGGNSWKNIGLQGAHVKQIELYP